MKYTISIIGILFFIASSCNNKNDIPTENTGVEFVLEKENKKVRLLDVVGGNISFNIVSGSNAISSMEIYRLDPPKIETNSPDPFKISDAVVSGGKAVFPLSAVGADTLKKILKNKRTLNLRADAKDAQGQLFRRYVSISVASSIATAGGKAASSAAPGAVVYNKATADTLYITSTSLLADISSATFAAEWKKAGGTYASDPSVSLLPENDGEFSAVVPNKSRRKAVRIIFKNFTSATAPYNLNIKDTLCYRFTFSLGTVQDVSEIKLPIVSQKAPSTASRMVYSDPLKSKLDLNTGNHYGSSETKGDIMFLANSGFERVSRANDASTPQNEENRIDFAKITLNGNDNTYGTYSKYIAEKDLFKIKADYDAGTKATSFASVAYGDIYAYRVVRSVRQKDKTYKDVVYYGLIGIAEIKSTNGMVDSIAIDCGEGFLDQ